jgi:hypothetical protein
VSNGQNGNNPRGAQFIDAFALASSPPRVDAMMLDSDFGGSPARPASGSSYHGWDESAATGSAVGGSSSMGFAPNGLNQQQPAAHSASTSARSDGTSASSSASAGPAGATMSVGPFGIAPPGESLRDTLLRGSASAALMPQSAATTAPQQRRGEHRNVRVQLLLRSTVQSTRR